ncbi:MAG: hypothetical protein IK079_06155 [Desulfovibrio sp.]|nr:hypothetical protein [Desulfovibrio sp.]
MKNSSATIFEEWYAAVKKMPVRKRRETLELMLDYCFDPESYQPSNDPMIESFLYAFKAKVDHDVKSRSTRAENGKKGGRPSKANDNQDVSELEEYETENKANQNLGFENENLNESKNNLSESKSKANETEAKPNDNLDESKNNLNESKKKPSSSSCSSSIYTPLTPQGENEHAKSVYSDDFEKFWQHYPRKVNKGSAWKMFEKARKAKILPEIDELIERLENKRYCDDWQKDDGRYIPHPSTWLNSSGWEEELKELGELQRKYEALGTDEPDVIEEKNRMYDLYVMPKIMDMKARGCKCV